MSAPEENGIAMSSVDVSVVTANYNNAAFLHDFFQAWLESTLAPRELIFIDDGSVDDSLEIANSYSESLSFLQIVALGKNNGFGNALNVGVARANGKYIMRIDPDDVILPERLAQQLQLLEVGIADVVGSNALVFQSNSGKTIGRTNFPLLHTDIEQAIRCGEHGILHPTVMAQAHFFKQHLYVQDAVPAEDYDIFARMLRSGAKFANIKEPLLRYRIHQRSASNILPFSTIVKTYQLRDRIFGTKTSRLQIAHYYLHIKSYRKYLFAQNRWERAWYLGIASLLRPDKALKRVIRSIEGLHAKFFNGHA
jgi:glycosyltransferase involved in cell wall biosynthesis